MSKDTTDPGCPADDETVAARQREALEKRVRAREPAALAEYIELRRAQMLAYIQRQVSSALAKKIDADDLLQDVSAAALRALPDYDLGDRDPFSWLCQLAERRIIDAHRRFTSQKRSSERELAIDAADPDSSQGGLVNLLVASLTTPSEAFSRDQRQFKLQEALRHLDETPREALRLRYVEGLPTKEIAERLGKTDGAVRVMLTRSLSKLQVILGSDAAPK